MVFVKNVKFCEAETGEYIVDFAKEAVSYRKSVQFDIVVKFADILMEVTLNTTEEDIILYYQEMILRK